MEMKPRSRALGPHREVDKMRARSDIASHKQWLEIVIHLYFQATNQDINNSIIEGITNVHGLEEGSGGGVAWLGY